jgi:hypothetical protein
MTYRCISDRYTPTADVFESAEDFQAMCRACFGEAPELRRDGEDYRDDQGIVLEHVKAARCGYEPGEIVHEAGR